MKSYCMKCGKGLDNHMAWCESCHKKIAADLHAREKLPCGGTSCPKWFDAPRVFRIEDDGGPSLKECRDLLADFVNRNVRCCGLTVPLPEDDSGPWQQNAIRCWEDAG